jgi:hypothetical protein
MAGRPLEISAEPRELEPCDPKTIAPLNGDGFPDMMNYMPTRLVPKDEAIARGWPMFYQAEACRYGHTAPRYVSNPRQCVDCFRLKRGKATLTAAPAQPEYKRPYAQRAAAPETGAAPPAVARPAEPDRTEKMFLGAYAELKDLDVAALRAGVTGAQILARLSWSPVFAAAVKALEDKLGMVYVTRETGPFEWTPEKRTRLLEVWVDTGDLATARDSIRVTPSEYFREIERNPEFSTAIEEATPLAVQALEDKATQLALSGNDKLLQKLLTVKKPEYREKLDLNVNDERKLTDAQLDTQLTRLVTKFRGRIIDAEYTELEPVRQIAAPDHVEGNRAPREAEPNSDLL